MPILSGAIRLEWFAGSELEGLDSVDLPASGVFVVWHGGAQPRVVRVGYGNVTERLAQFRADPRMMAFGQFGPLFVAWAEVPDSRARGVAKFLVSRLRPINEDPLRGVVAIPATLPF